MIIELVINYIVCFSYYMFLFMKISDIYLSLVLVNIYMNEFYYYFNCIKFFKVNKISYYFMIFNLYIRFF